MGVDLTEAPRANAFKTVLDTVVAPADAFAQLREAPTWGWAFVLALVLAAIGSYLLTPALIHATQADWPRMVATNPQMAQAPADRQQIALAFTLKALQFSWIAALFATALMILVGAVVMLILKAIGKGDASFAQLWAAAANIAVPTLGLGELVTGIIVTLRGAGSFGSAADVQAAMPSLAMLVPDTALKLHAFLAAITPFSLWNLGLAVTAMIVLARVPRVWAWIAGIVLLLIPAGLAALGAR